MGTFAGAISNTGLISATNFDGIGVFTGAVFGNSVAGGAIVNSGAIVASTGIDVQGVATFVGNITNSKGGAISAGHVGIEVGGGFRVGRVAYRQRGE